MKPVPAIDIQDRSVLLVYLFSGLGDLILVAPVVKALLDAGAVPPIGLLARLKAKSVFQVLDLPVKLHVIDEEICQIPYDEDEGRPHVVKLSVSLRRKGYDIGVDLTARSDMEAAAWLQRAECPIRLGFEGAADMTYAAPDERHEGLEHWSRYLCKPLKPLRLGPLPSTLPFVFSSRAEDKALDLWGADASFRVLLIPGSRDLEKRVSQDLFTMVGRALTDRGATVVVAGGPDEAKLCKSIAKHCSQRYYTNKTLEPLLKLATDADLVITNDTGPMHASFFSERNVIALFSTMPRLCWGPLHSQDRFKTINVPSSSSSREMEVIAQWLVDRANAAMTEHLK